jgi:hypothetical protein
MGSYLGRLQPGPYKAIRLVNVLYWNESVQKSVLLAQYFYLATIRPYFLSSTVKLTCLESCNRKVPIVRLLVCLQCGELVVELSSHPWRDSLLFSSHRLPYFPSLL